MGRLRSRTVVGRANELAVLDDALRGASGGEPVALVLTGDAGVGKTRLLDEALTRAEAAGFLPLCGRAAPLDGGAAPLLSVVDAFDGLRERIDEATWRLLSEELPASAAWLLGVAVPVAASSPEVGGGAERTQLLGLVLRVLRRLSAERPVVLAVDDVHWADGSTRDVLSFAVRALRGERLVVLVTVRGEALAAGDALRDWAAELARAPCARRVDLSPLSPAAVVEQLTDILGREPRTGLADRVVQRSGGNPFLVEELLAAGDGGLPATVRDALLGRLSGLQSDTLLLVRAAAAAGRSTDPRLLTAAAVTALDPDAMDAAIRDAVRHAVLVVDGPRVTFRHDLVREVVHDDLLPGERDRLHAALAAALEAAPDLAPGGREAALSQVAAHWRAARDEPRAVAAAVAAARAAVARHAYRAALEQFEAAIALGARDHEVLGEAAIAAGMCTENHRAVELFDLAIVAAPDPAAEGQLHAWRGLYLTQIGRGDESRAELLLGARLMPRDESPERARALANLAFGLVFEGGATSGVLIAAEALRVSRLSGALAAESMVWNALGIALTKAGRFDEAFVRFETATRTGAAAGSPDSEIIGMNNLADALARAGRWEAGFRLGIKGAARAQELGIAGWGPFLLCNAAWCLLALGRWHEAEALLVDGVAAGPTDTTALNFEMTAAELALGRGRLEAAEEHLGRVEDLAGREAGVEVACALFDLRAELLWQRGEFDAAQALALDAVRLAVTAPDVPVATASLVRGLGIAADLAGRARARRDPAAEQRAYAGAQALDAAFAELTDTRPAPAAVAAHEAQAAAERARLSGGDDAPAWANAQEAWAALGARPRESYACWRRAEALLAAGASRDDAAALLVPAHAWATEAGAAPLLHELELLAARARLDLGAGRTRAATASDDLPAAAAAYGLTARELEVLAHLAAGRTNRQIADKLFISVKTAGSHVQRVMHKLDVHTRSAAGAVARRAGLVDDETPDPHAASAPSRPG